MSRSRGEPQEPRDPERAGPTAVPVTPGPRRRCVAASPGDARPGFAIFPGPGLLRPPPRPDLPQTPRHLTDHPDLGRARPPSTPGCACRPPASPSCRRRAAPSGPPRRGGSGGRRTSRRGWRRGGRPRRRRDRPRRDGAMSGWAGRSEHRTAYGGPATSASSCRSRLSIARRRFLPTSLSAPRTASAVSSWPWPRRLIERGAQTRPDVTMTSRSVSDSRSPASSSSTRSADRPVRSA